MLILGAEDGVVVDVDGRALGTRHGEAGENQDREAGEAGHWDLSAEGAKRDDRPLRTNRDFFRGPPPADDCPQPGWIEGAASSDLPGDRQPMTDRM